MRISHLSFFFQFHIVIICFFSFGVPAEEHLSEKNVILQKFKDSFNWIDTTAMHVESSLWRGSALDEVEVYDFDCYIDGDHRFRTVGTRQSRNPHTGKLTTLPNGGVVDEQVQTFFSREDSGGFYLQHTAIGDYDGREDYLSVWEAGDDRVRLEKTLGHPFAMLSGYATGFSTQALYDLLTPDNFIVREEINDSVRSYVIEAIVDQGSIELWLSPDQDYGLQKYILTKEAGKDFNAKGSEIFGGVDFFTGKTIKRSIIEMTVSETQSVDGRFIPLQVDYLYREEMADESRFEMFRSAAISEVDINPDFDASGAFNFVVPAGASVDFIRKDGTSLTGFKWEDAKLVADVDADALDDNIRTALAQLKTGDPSLNKNKGGIRFQMDGLGGTSGFLFRQGRLLTWISGALFLLACGTVGIFAYKNRKEKTNLTEADSPTDEESSHASEGLEEHE